MRILTSNEYQHRGKNKHMKPIKNALKTAIFTTVAQNGVSFKTAIKRGRQK